MIPRYVRNHFDSVVDSALNEGNLSKFDSELQRIKEIAHDSIGVLEANLSQELSAYTFEVHIQDILANDKRGAVLTLERGRRGSNVLENRAVHIYDIRGGKCARMRALTRTRGVTFGHNGE